MIYFIDQCLTSYQCLHSDEKDNLLAGVLLEELTYGPQKFTEPDAEWIKLVTKTILSNFKVSSMFSEILYN